MRYQRDYRSAIVPPLFRELLSLLALNHDYAGSDFDTTLEWFILIFTITTYVHMHITPSLLYHHLISVRYISLAALGVLHHQLSVCWWCNTPSAVEIGGSGYETMHYIWYGSKQVQPFWLDHFSLTRGVGEAGHETKNIALQWAPRQ